MITNDRDRRICKEYSARDAEGLVHCNECPLRKNQGVWDFRCKANSRYNRKTREWEYDDVQEHELDTNDSIPHWKDWREKIYE